MKQNTLLGKSCGSDCFNEGLESGKNKDYIKARLYYEIACNEKGSAAGCNNLGVLYGNGQGVAKIAPKQKLFMKNLARWEL